MAQRNSERLLNLVIALLDAPRFLSREEIRQRVAGYETAGSEAAFQRMFERDKQDLRAMGVELQIRPSDPSSAQLDGYRVAPSDFYLPHIHLTPQESTLVGLAAAVWSEPTVAADVGRATVKLRAAGEDVAAGPASFMMPRLGAREPGFPVVWQALLSRTPLRFTYHHAKRRVFPWRLILRSGAWYVLGEDQAHGVRLFRLSRMEDAPRLDGEPGSYVLPDAAIIADHAARVEPPAPTATVLLALRRGAADSLRRRGEVLTTAAPTDPGWLVTPPDFDVVAVSYALVDEIVSAICAAGPDVLVIEPGLIRERVIAHLRALVEVGS
ncbi:MAG: WYL domain-containing protein [Propionibacteriaceae bacterium]|jgi:proteasome accessory factor B|nr:WYL domain-containing protein [Propionibacteriaceae bacterium]